MTVYLDHVGIYRRVWGLGSGWPEMFAHTSLCEVSWCVCVFLSAYLCPLGLSMFASQSHSVYLYIFLCLCM